MSLKHFFSVNQIIEKMFQTHPDIYLSDLTVGSFSSSVTVYDWISSFKDLLLRNTLPCPCGSVVRNEYFALPRLLRRMQR